MQKKLSFFLIFVFLGRQAPIFAEKSNWDLLSCGLRKCTRQMFQCMSEDKCRKTLACNRECGASGSKADQQACHLVCQLGKGKQSTAYPELVSCFAKKQCLPKLEPGKDGVCPVNPSNIHKVLSLSSISELKGVWLELKGLNCGKQGSGWEGAYDALPCRSSSWISSKGSWWYHTSFCKPGSGQQCDGGRVHLLASPSLSLKERGLIEVPYIDPPLKPQDERWYVLARPHPDWLMYTYCGSTPAGSYAGLNIATRSVNAKESKIPKPLEDKFREAALSFGLDYDSFCDNDHRDCPVVKAEEDIAHSTASKVCN